MVMPSLSAAPASSTKYTATNLSSTVLTTPSGHDSAHEDSALPRLATPLGTSPAVGLTDDVTALPQLATPYGSSPVPEINDSVF